VARESPGLEAAGVGIEFAGEQHASPAGVEVLVGRDGGVPKVPGEFAVGGGEEEVALVFVLRTRLTSSSAAWR
jgi:hypothetical protein